MAFFNSFEPRMLQSLMAEGATKFGGPVKKIKQQMERDQLREEDRAADMADRQEASEIKTADQDRARRLEQIDGESPMQRQVRLQNQAWNPNKYGDKYRAQFNKNQISPEQAVAADEERRRKRLMMSMSRPAAEDEE